MNKLYGIPVAEDLEYVTDFPHTITYALLYRSRINGYRELSEDKRPPRNLWDKPHQLEEFFNEVFKVDTDSSKGGKTYIEYSPEDIE